MDTDNGGNKRKRSEFVPWTQDLETPNFEELAHAYPDFAKAYRSLQQNQQVKGTYLPFASNVTPEFNVALARALVHFKFQLHLPQLPPDRLCPPIPNRYFYVNWIQTKLLPMLHSPPYFESLVSETAVASEQETHWGIDLGTGASCIYPLLFMAASRKHVTTRRWKLIATEVDSTSVDLARENVKANRMDDCIQVQLVRPTDSQQETAMATDRPMGPLAVLELSSHGIMDFVMTNPPFFDDAVSSERVDPRAGDARARTPMTAYEGSYPGGELGFLMDLVYDSWESKNKVGWYSGMCGKKTTWTHLVKLLTHWLGPGHIQTAEYGPGYMTRWFVAWTFGRPCLRSPLARLSHQDDFSVSASVQDVVDRVRVFAETLPAFKLVCDTQVIHPHQTLVSIREPTPVVVTTHVDETEKVSSRNESFSRLLERMKQPGLEPTSAMGFLPAEGHFVVDVTVTAYSDSTSRVCVTAFRHSAHGAKAVAKIRLQMEGEVCRTNRRWRRLLKRQQNNKAGEML